MMKEGSKVKVIGVTDRNDKQVCGTLISYVDGGICIVDVGERMIGIMSTELKYVL